MRKISKFSGDFRRILWFINPFYNLFTDFRQRFDNFNLFIIFWSFFSYFNRFSWKFYEIFDIFFIGFHYNFNNFRDVLESFHDLHFKQFSYDDFLTVFAIFAIIFMRVLSNLIINFKQVLQCLKYFQLLKFSIQKVIPDNNPLPRSIRQKSIWEMYKYRKRNDTGNRNLIHVSSEVLITYCKYNRSSFKSHSHFNYEYYSIAATCS